jgi:hypothetical protein
MKISPYILFLFIPTLSVAQDIQLQYDFGKPENGPRHNYFISTVEMYRPDSLGSLYFFIDFQYNSPDKPKGVSLGYFEISHEFYMPWFKNNKIFKPLTIHIEYDDGNAIYLVDSITRGTNLRSSWLGGFAYPIQIGKFTLNTIYLYKYIRGSSTPDFQVTFAWGQNLFHNKVTLSGFLDIWSQDDFYGDPANKKLILYSEPQIWYNFYRKFAIGSEFKVSKNFLPGSNRVEVFPTLGVKWDL